MERNPYQSPSLKPEPPDANMQPKLRFWKLAVNGFFAGVLYGSCSGTLISLAGGVFGLAWDWSATVGEQAEFNAAIATLFGMASFGAMWGAVLGGVCGCYISCLVRVCGPKPGFWAHYLSQVVPAIATLSTLTYAMVQRGYESPHRTLAVYVVLFFLVIVGAVVFSETMTSLCFRKIWGDDSPE